MSRLNRLLQRFYNLDKYLNKPIKIYGDRVVFIKDTDNNIVLQYDDMKFKLVFNYGSNYWEQITPINNHKYSYRLLTDLVSLFNKTSDSDGYKISNGVLLRFDTLPLSYLKKDLSKKMSSELLNKLEELGKITGYNQVYDRLIPSNYKSTKHDSNIIIEIDKIIRRFKGAEKGVITREVNGRERFKLLDTCGLKWKNKLLIRMADTHKCLFVDTNTSKCYMTYLSDTYTDTMRITWRTNFSKPEQYLDELLKLHEMDDVIPELKPYIKSLYEEAIKNKLNQMN